jgi:hypothetical protein
MIHAITNVVEGEHMSTANPLTANRDIQRTANLTTLNKALDSPVKVKSSFAVYSDDVVEISQLGLEKQQKAQQIETSRHIDDIANEVIRVSSTIGKSRSSGRLTQNQAVELYNKIASLL